MFPKEGMDTMFSSRYISSTSWAKVRLVEAEIGLHDADIISSDNQYQKRKLSR
jgi:hypothetical protein